MRDGVPHERSTGFRRRGPSVLVALLGFGLLAAADRARGQETENAPPTARESSFCEVVGRATLRGVRVIRAGRGSRSRVETVDLVDRRVGIRLVSPTLARVRSIEEPTVIEGDISGIPELSLRGALARPGVVVRAGASLARWSLRDRSLDADVALGEGVLLRRVVVDCEALEPTPVERLSPASPGAVDPLASDRWRARGREVALRDLPDTGVEASRLAIPPTVELFEVGRADGFVRVVRDLGWGRIDGWAREAALVPAR